MTFQQFLSTGLLLAVVTTLSAQKTIKGTATDDNYAYTTVVYKDSSATDQQVLEQMDENLGIGDVVRITVAPPKPKPAPAVQSAPKVAIASAPRVVKPSPAAPNSSILVASDDKNVVMQQISRKPAAVVPAPAPTQNTVFADTPPVVTNEQGANNGAVSKGSNAAPAVQKSITAKKSGAGVKKSSGKSKKSYGKAPKNKKRSKQRYGCFKF